MKRILILLISFFSLFNLFSQDLSFERNFIFEPEKITGQNQRMTYIDYDNDGDQDILLGDGTNEDRIKLFKNDNGVFNDIEVIHNGRSGSNSINGPFAVGDLDGDGDQDIVFTTGKFYLLENDNGNFLDAVELFDPVGTTSSLTAPHIIDFDNDGDQDILFTESSNSGNDLVLLRNANMTFSEEELITSSIGLPEWFEPIDMENDGDYDFLIFPRDADAVLAINNGDETFTINDFSDLVPSGQSGTNLNAADFNKDGFIDFVSLRSDEAQVHVNDQDNTFTTFTLQNYSNSGFSYGRKPRGIYTFDYDSDGDEDILVGESDNWSDANGVVFENDGSGAFTKLNSVTIDNAYMTNLVHTADDDFIPEVFSSDFDMDEDMDLVTLTRGDNDLIVHYQNVDGTFNSDNNLNLHFGNYLQRLQVIDYDMDGDLDLLSTQSDNDSFDNGEKSKVTISVNNGTGSFATRVILDNIPYVHKAAILTDWESDNKQDLIYSNGHEIFIQFDIITKETSNLYSMYQAPGYDLSAPDLKLTENTLRLVDIDGDGDEDLAFHEEASSTDRIKWIENENLNSFATAEFVVSGLPRINNGFAFGDLDGDGDLDFAWASDTETFTYLNDANTFTLDQTKTNSDGDPNGDEENIFVLDYDNDGDNDIIYYADDNRSVFWYENTDGSGKLANEVSILNEIGFSKIGIQDITNDGYVDFILSDPESPAFGEPDSLLFYINNQLGDFTIQKIELDARGNGDVVFGDMDANGTIDIILPTDYSFDSKPDIEPVWVSTCLNTASQIDRVVCGSFTAPSGSVFSESGIYEDVIPNQYQCDSTITINLTVNPIYDEEQSVSICSGDSYIFGSQTLATAGQYTELFTSHAGCDSTVVLTLSVNPIFNETATATICDGESFTFGTQTLSTAGDFTEVFQSQAGCDSTVVLSLLVNSVFNETASATICEGDSYTFGTQSLTIAGDFTEVFQSQAGCDSTVVLTLGFKSEIECEKLLSVDDQLAKSIKVYPNPFDSEISFEFTNPVKGKIQIHDVSGRLKYESNLLNDTSLTVKSIKTSGTYIVTITGEGKEIVKFKIVKQ